MLFFLKSIFLACFFHFLYIVFVLVVLVVYSLSLVCSILTDMTASKGIVFYNIQLFIYGLLNLYFYVHIFLIVILHVFSTYTNFIKSMFIIKIPFALGQLYLLMCSQIGVGNGM